MGATGQDALRPTFLLSGFRQPPFIHFVIKQSGKSDHVMVIARLVIGAATLAVVALGLVHLLRPDIHPGSTMISQYARGRFGWVMTLCFAAFAVGSALVFASLVSRSLSFSGHVGLALLITTAIGLGMAARFPMDPVSTPRERLSFSGRMHGLSFLIGVPCQILAVLFLSLALTSFPLLLLTAVIWISFGIMIAIMLIVGPGKPPNPKGPERFLGAPNRMFMVAYGAWLIVAAWPMAR